MIAASYRLCLVHSLPCILPTGQGRAARQGCKAVFKIAVSKETSKEAVACFVCEDSFLAAFMQAGLPCFVGDCLVVAFVHAANVAVSHTHI